MISYTQKMDEAENLFCNRNTKEVTPHMPRGEKKLQKNQIGNKILKLGSLIWFSKHYRHTSQMLRVQLETTTTKEILQ